MPIYSGNNGVCENLNVTVTCATKPGQKKVKRETGKSTQSAPAQVEYYRAIVTFPASRCIA